MRCSCQNCGEYMVQKDAGIESGCVCPICFAKCTACTDNKTTPLSKEALRDLYEISIKNQDNQDA